MADYEARETGSSAFIMSLAALVLLVVIGGFVFFRADSPNPVTIVERDTAPNTTVQVQPPPVVNINPAPAAPAPAAPAESSGGSTSESSKE